MLLQCWILSSCHDRMRIEWKSKMFNKLTVSSNLMVNVDNVWTISNQIETHWVWINQIFVPLYSS